MKNYFKNRAIRLICAALALIIAAGAATGCARGGETAGLVKLDTKNPVVISVWHYYNGAIMNAFNSHVAEFNETVGATLGIIVESYGVGNVTELEREVIASANREVGSQEMPNIFASYADTAYAAEKMGLLADLGAYFTPEEQSEYIDAYIEEGRIGPEGELRILPIAKSTEILMVNETDWLPFAGEHGLTYDDLATMRGIANVSRLYYDWTDAKTPETPEDGKSFFGRDSMANMFIIASKEYGTEIFSSRGGTAEINVNPEVMRYIWDYYYVPYINGYYTSYGKFRSDDAKVGDIIAYVGSTSSSSYFPAEVTVNGAVYPVDAKVLPAPGFDGPDRVIVQQGAGMVVTKGTPQEEYASVVFLKWFTQEDINIRFSTQSGYMPVKKTANDYEKILAAMREEYSADSGGIYGEITEMTLAAALEEMSDAGMYTNKAFDGGAAARAVLESNLQDKAAADRQAVLAMLENGQTRQAAVDTFDTQENFEAWVGQLTTLLSEAAK